jgi:hypothetical protein
MLIQKTTMCVMILLEVMILRFHYRHCNNELWYEKSLLSIWTIYARYVTKMKRKFISWTLRYAMTVGWSKLVQKWVILLVTKFKKIIHGSLVLGLAPMIWNLCFCHVLRCTHNSKSRKSSECLNQVYLIECSTVLTVQAKYMIGAFSFHRRSSNQFGFLFFLGTWFYFKYFLSDWLFIKLKKLYCQEYLVLLKIQFILFSNLVTIYSLTSHVKVQGQYYQKFDWLFFVLIWQVPL